MGITLSAGVRQNLQSLQQTSSLLNEVQGRLATGRKVNSALDNPGSFFTAQGLSNRANDLSNLLDDQGQSIQVLKAADQGITAISKLVDSAKAKATQALQSTDTTSRAKYAGEYTEILNQITAVAKDSGYNGKNLLGGAGNDLTVVFNETSSSKLKISSVDYTGTSGLGLDTTVKTGQGTGFAANTAATTNAGVADGQFLNVNVGSAVHKIDLKTTDTIADVVSKINSGSGGDAHADYDATTGKINITSGQAFTVDHLDGNNSNAAVSGSTLAVSSNSDSSTISFSSDSEVNKVISALTATQNTLRSQSSTFGTNLSTVQVRQDFTNNLIGTLQTGSDKLTLADTNQEGANLLALQTQQSLSSTALSLASRSDQSVLRLIGG